MKVSVLALFNVSSDSDFPTMSDDKQADPCHFDGDALSKATQALAVARRQVRRAQTTAESWRVEGALAEVEDDLGVDLSKIRDAQDGDEADREESGEAAVERRSYSPRAV